MRTLNAIIIFLSLISSFLLAETDKDYTDAKIKEVYEMIIKITGVVDKNSQKINEINKGNLQKSQEIQELQEKIENLEQKIDSNIKDTELILDSMKKNNDICKKYVIPIAGIIFVLILYLLYKLGKKDSIVTQISTNSSQSKCPMCGWEHAPDDKVCKNCGTKF